MENESDARTLAVVGLGYVGLPLAAAFARHRHVIGYDVSAGKIKTYQAGHDPTEELGDKAIRVAPIEFTSDETRLREASFIVVAVPTPVHEDKTPDLRPLAAASETVGRNLSRGAAVVFESTVYPGVTEEVCKPILEKASGLAAGRDFHLGYSPERINPGDPRHHLESVVKIVSGLDPASLAVISAAYREVVAAGVYEAPSIRVAEAAKVVENTQRDINIAFMNELAMVCQALGLNTQEVIKAMDTKWNALGFRPGLVGGHCIGIDPYYFIHQADLLGCHPRLIDAGRRVNEAMGRHVADNLLKEMVLAGLDVARAKICLLGLTFKEDCPDTRNSMPVEIYRLLAGYGIHVVAVDPEADPGDFAATHGFALSPPAEVAEADCLAVLVAHRAYRELSPLELRACCKAGVTPVLVDVKGLYDPAACRAAGFRYWSL